jgi:hypothetical protein
MSMHRATVAAARGHATAGAVARTPGTSNRWSVPAADRRTRHHLGGRHEMGHRGRRAPGFDGAGGAGYGTARSWHRTAERKQT